VPCNRDRNIHRHFAPRFAISHRFRLLVSCLLRSPLYRDVNGISRSTKQRRLASAYRIHVLSPSPPCALTSPHEWF
jgi:hypothetical protein